MKSYNLAIIFAVNVLGYGLIYPIYTGLIRNPSS